MLGGFMEPILKVNKLSKIYHTEKEEIIALDTISFDVVNLLFFLFLVV